MNVSILGCGRWGSFLSWYLSGLSFKVKLWGPPGGKSLEALIKKRANEYVALPETVALTSCLKDAANSADIIIISISAQGLRGFMKELAPYLSGKTVILCMKGLEHDTGKRLTEVAAEGGADPQNLAIWVGPGHIQEFVRGIPNCMLIDSYSAALTKKLADLFKSNLIRFYYGSDIIGAEIGAAAKNVMGIVAGMLDGLGLSTLKGPLMARGCREVARLIAASGGKELTAYGLSHLGDYETTLFSVHSHNRGWGEAYSKGQRFDRLAEGVPTAGALITLSRRLGVDMPITAAVNSVIEDSVPTAEIIARLFDREAKEEFA